MSRTEAAGKTGHRGLGWATIVAAALLARLAVIVTGFGRLDDPDNYLVLARSLAAGRGFALDGHPTAYRPPLYPVVLAPLVAMLGGRIAWGIAGLHLLLGAGTVVLTAAAARRWGLSPGRALLAAAVVGCDPVLVAQGRVVMTEVLAAFLMAAALAALAEGNPRGAAWGGVWLGLGTLCRPGALPVAGLVTVAAGFVRPGPGPVRLRRAAAIAMATVATLIPWAWRNARLFGEPVWTTTHGGYTLALANNPAYYAAIVDGPPGAAWSGPDQRRWFVAVDRAMRGLSEPEADRRFRALGLRMVVEQPRDFARSSLARLGRLWGVAPSGAVYPRAPRIATAIWTVPLWMALARGLTRRTLWRWPQVGAPLVVVALSAVHALYWTDLRMRAGGPGHRPDCRLGRNPPAGAAPERRPRGSELGTEWSQKNRKIPRILLFKFPRNVRLKTAALGGIPLVSRLGR
ncbi:MAG TPA: phospholipid carrier-dependent glycosyltransferase [Isosphaeraceae bacterium]|nr:phospholipid carrier-dependent glycosyltransferase [Isosphaeraceae bacterium]